MSGYSSGYESEAAASECPSVEEAERESQRRRARTKFTPEQIDKLEKIFSKHKYLDAGERMKTARRLGLTETQVRVGSHLGILPRVRRPGSERAVLFCRSGPGSRTGG